MNNKVSVVIPFFNEIELINRAVQSAQRNLEKFPGSEILICNDSSYTGAQILEMIDCQSSTILKVVKNRGSKGPGANRNAGIDDAKNDIIAFLDADDYWKPDKISAQIDLINEGFNFIATAYEFEYSETIIKPANSIKKPIEVFMKRGLGTSTIIITKELFSSLRFSNIRYAQDIDFWFRLSQNTSFRYACLDTSFVVYSTNGSTRNKFEQLRYVNKVLVKNHISTLQRIFILFRYSVAGIWNHYIKNYFGLNKIVKNLYHTLQK